MENVQTILILLLLIIISNIINKKIPNISVPLIQIVLGMLMGMIWGTALHLESDLFMLLFIAPILFMDGKRISNRELWKFKKPIIQMAIGLVFSTILVCGVFVHWMIPGLPYAVGFALAAVLSPTDAVAVKAISNRIHLPHNVTTIVEGESLLNDASGLVAFNFAIAAALTGAFSIKDAALSFVYIALGGAFLGVVATYLIMFFTHKLKDMGVEDATVFTLIQIITPFAIYFFAEELGFSGVLAVVASGIIYSIYPNRRVSVRDANIKFVSDGTWATLLFVLNGLIFLLLGMELPSALKNVIQSDKISNLTSMGYVLAVSVVLIAIRFIWTFIFVGKGYGNRLQNSVLTALSGARGAVTLAACFSIPLFLSDGTQFPQRDLLLFISGGVIIVMLLISNIILPMVAPKPTLDSDESVKIANRKVIQAAIHQLNSEMNEDNKHAVYSLITHYESLLNTKDERERSIRSERRSESKILLLGLAAEKKEIEQLMLDSNYDKGVLRRISDAIDLMQIQLNERSFFYGIKHRLAHTLINRKLPVDIDELARTKMVTIKAAIAAITQNITPHNEAKSKRVIEHYASILDFFAQTRLGERGKEYVETKKKLEFNAIQAQKIIVQEMLEMGEITYAASGKLRNNIRFAEFALFSEELQ